MTPPDRRATPAGLPAVARTTGTALATIPEQLQEIADLVGQRVALSILAAKGGSEINIPRRAGPDHWLSRLVGAEVAERICAHYRVQDVDGHSIGGLRIYVPLANTGALASMRVQLVRGLEQGLTVRDAARRAGMSERTAHRLLGKIRDPRQGDLFGPCQLSRAIGAADPPSSSGEFRDFPGEPGATPMRRPRVVGVLINIGQSLLSLDRKADRIMTKLDDLKAADAAENAAVLSALSEVKRMSEEHAADVAELAAQSAAGDDLGPLVASMQARSQSLTAAVSALHTTVSALTGTTDSVTGAGSDTIAVGTADTVAGADSATVAGADTVTGAGADTVAAS